MQTLYLSHPQCERHAMSPGHPESPARLQAITRQLEQDAWRSRLAPLEAVPIAENLLSGVHSRDYLTMLTELDPGDALAKIDADTALNKHSLSAAKIAAGAGVQAVEAVIAGSYSNAFCAVRPPGHHAESVTGMGFCVFNSIALAAERALSLGAERIAILDFDVHHGNGTVEIFQDRPEVLVCSSFQYPFYPGRFDRIDRPNIILTPLDEGTQGAAFRAALHKQWAAALQAHQPDCLLVSAGFDAHLEDPLAGLCLNDDDFHWLGQFIRDLAETHCRGRVVSMLEGGYNTAALARSVAQYLLAFH